MSPAEAKAEAIRQRPELAPILNALPGSSLTKLIEQLDKQNAAGQEKFKANEGRLGLAGLSNALIAAGEATRGHKGMALGEALGGFGKNYGKYTEESVKRDEAQQALQRQYQVESAKLQSEVESLQRAYANNDVNGIMNHDKAVAEQKAKVQGIRTQAAKFGIDVSLAEENYADQRSKSAAQLAETKLQHEFQRKQWASENANKLEQLQIMRDTRPSIEDKSVAKIMAAMPARVKGLELKQKDFDFGSDEWNQIQGRIDDMYDQAYAAYNLAPPPRLALPKPLVPQEKPGFFSSVFGSSKTPKPVSFDQLPK
jgi:hypothetical protein